MEGLRTLSNELAAAVERASQAVVGVSGRPRLGSTGVHWRDGFVVTAHHTVHADEGITVIRPDGRTISATVAGRDPGSDVAVLKVDGLDGPAADIAPAESPRVGHIVLALGHGPRASWGVVSAIGEGPTRRHGRGDFLSLDLTLYPGFSGGPLVDVQGRVVGMNTSGGSRRFHLAIPSLIVNRVVDELITRGRVRHAYLGVGTQAVRLPETLREQLHLDQETAVIVVDVRSGGPAATAGLLMGDVITSLDGTPVMDPEDLQTVLRPERVGQSIAASIIRGGVPKDVAVVVGERPQHRRPA